jgi:hypothetical protein
VHEVVDIYKLAMLEVKWRPHSLTHGSFRIRHQRLAVCLHHSQAWCEHVYTSNFNNTTVHSLD